MSATILTFPRTACFVAPPRVEPQPIDGTPISAIALARKVTDHFLPVVQASVDLLETDEHDFEARCRLMLDVDGTAMIDELCEELEIVGRQMQVLVDGLDLTRARLRTGMSRLAVSRQIEGVV